MRFCLTSIIWRINGSQWEGTFNGLLQRIIQYFYAFSPPKQQTTAVREKQHNNLYLQLSETKLQWISTERQSHCFSSLSPRSTLFLFHKCTHTHTQTHPNMHTGTHKHNRSSQGNMKGPGRYRDILGPSSISHGQEL